MAQKNKERVYIAIISLLLFAVGFLLFFENDLSRISDVEPVTLESGNYLTFVYMGNSQCAFCNDELHQFVIELKNKLDDISKQAGYRYLTMGISTDVLSFVGVEYLKSTAPYDEIIAGGSLYNLGVEHFVWTKFPWRASTPQVILTETRFEILSDGLLISNIEREEKLLLRLTGFYEIEDFYNRISKLNTNEIKKIIGIREV